MIKTPLDLRIKYKSETGLAPTYGRDSGGCCNYQRGLTHDYAVWLETDDDKRIYFKRDTSKDGTYHDNHGDIHYTKEYKECLEERMCKIYTILEKLKK